jgi:hypothetical protein
MGIFILMFWFLCGGAAAFVAAGRADNPWFWLLIGLLLGPIGFLLALTSTGEPCPKCASRISKNAWRCPNCNSALAPALRAVSDRENDRTRALVDALQSRKH